MDVAKRTAVLFAPLLLLYGCARGGAPAPTGSMPVATINGTPVTVEDFAIEWNLIRGAKGGIAPMGESAAKSLKTALLSRMIETRLVLAAAKGKVEVTDQEVQQELAEMRTGYSDEQFNETMVGGFMTQETLKKRVRDRLVSDRFFQNVVFSDLASDQQEEEEYFRINKKNFERPEKVRVQQIVVRTEDEIVQVHERLKAGEDFSAVCRRFSEGPEAKTGCELPLFARGEMPKVFETAFSLEDGKVSDILPSPHGYHLIKLLKRYPSQTRTFEEARVEVRLAVLESKKRAAHDAWVDRARAAASVKIDQKLLDSIP